MWCLFSSSLHGLHSVGRCERGPEKRERRGGRGRVRPAWRAGVGRTGKSWGAGQGGAAWREQTKSTHPQSSDRGREYSIAIKVQLL